MEEQGMSNPFFKLPEFGGVPVGFVIAFAGVHDPSSDKEAKALEAKGWMICNGRSLSIHDYPELFAVLRYVYGGEGDQFQIPDYRHESLRGIATDQIIGIGSEKATVVDAKRQTYIIKYTCHLGPLTI